MGERRHTFLIVDDEEDVLDSLRHLFHRQYRVLTASNASRGLELLGQEDVHLILSDQRMPGMTGDEFLGRAREIRPDSIRMLFTGYADIQAVINAINQGHIFRYLVKPWDVGELEAVIRQAAEQYELLAERRRLIVELREANARLTRANQELAESSQLKSAFLEVASHEFNTPITLISGLSELLKLLFPCRDPEECEIVDQIVIASRKLARLVAATLKLMYADDFRKTLRREPTDLAALLRESVDQVGQFIRTRNLHLKIDVPDTLGNFEIDANKVRDAVVNLLTNAIKFTPDNGEIALAACLSDGDEAEIKVSDRGIGLEPKALNRLFQPFFTEFDPSRHSTGDFGFEKRGLGLGLSLVKKFVELHGGRVSAESTLGQGTRFTIRLPRRARSESHSPNGDGESRPLDTSPSPR